MARTNIVAMDDLGDSNVGSSGFFTNASAFSRGYGRVNEAKTLINNCKQAIIDFDLDNDDCKKFKKNINECNIEVLVDIIEETKTSLLNLDQEFAAEYLAILQESLQGVNYDSLSDAEKFEYNVLSQDYDKTMFTMYAKLDSLDCLSAEEKQYYEYLKLKNEQYDIQDKMSVLDPRSEEYINLFKENAELDRKIIKSSTTLTDTQKSEKLKAYDEQFYENLASLQAARDSMLEIESMEDELADLYAAKEDNNGFFHPCVESEIDEAILDKEIALGKAKGYDVSDMEEYKNMDGWDRFWTDTGTFVTSAFTGLFDITESIGDGFVMLGSVGGIVDKDWASEYVARDISGEMYQGIVLSTGMNSYSAYGDVHTAGMVFGNTVGHIGMSFAAPWANAILSGLEGLGSTSESVLAAGGSYWEAMGRGALSGFGGAFSGYAMSGLNANVTQFLKSGALKTIGSTVVNTIKNEGVKALVTGTWGAAQVGAKSLGKLALTSLADVDTWVETGCVFFDNILCGAADGEIDWGTTFAQTGTVFATEYGMNFLIGFSQIGVSSFKKYENYNDILAHYSLEMKQFENSLTTREKSLFKNYCLESPLLDGNYKSVNALGRGNLIDYNLETISFRGTYSTDVMSFDRFEKIHGEKIESFVSRQTAAALELNDALSKFSLNEDTILYRGVYFDAFQPYGILPSDSVDIIYKKLTANGNVYADNGFMSTAVIPAGITDDKPIVFELNCKAGTTGAFAESFNPFGENEFLLTAGQRFTIDRVERKVSQYSGASQVIVHMSSIPN